MEDKKKIWAVGILFAIGFSIFVIFLVASFLNIPADRPIASGWMLATGIACMVFSLLPFLGIKKLEFSKTALNLEFLATTEIHQQKEIPVEVKEERRKNIETYVERKNTQLPGQYAPDFHVLDEKLALTVTPCADPMTPMYMLDRNFRVIDWNTAFNLCFNWTLEGRRGLSVLEWTYFLDNYDEVVRHGIEVFSEGKTLPLIDIETIKYTNDHYGKIECIKRAYQIPDDDGSCLGWLITISPSFKEPEMEELYQADLFTYLRKTLVWSEYALCYDKVLNNSLIYPELIHTLLGNRQPGPSPVADSAVILDIGAGTGNISHLLAQQSSDRLIVAIENNPLMLNTLRRKCQAYLRHDALGAGIIAIKQDAVSLFGLNDDFFDYVIINNVLYSMETEAALSCLKEAWRVLKPGGEIRISEPQKSTDLKKVLDQIQADLKKNGKYTELQADFLKLCQINEFSLQPYLHRWTLKDLANILLQNFSSISYQTDKVYADQSLLICARK